MREGRFVGVGCVSVLLLNTALNLADYGSCLSGRPRDGIAPTSFFADTSSLTTCAIGLCNMLADVNPNDCNVDAFTCSGSASGRTKANCSDH